MINKTLVKKRFSDKAATYNDHAIVQRKMANHLLDYCENQLEKQPLSILEIGSGTGTMTKKLANLYPDASIDAVDLAPGMVETAKRYVTNDNVSFHCADFEAFTIENTYDLVISNAAFQWFNYLPETLVKTCRHVNEGGLFLFSTFGSSTFCELNQAVKWAVERLSYTKRVKVSQDFYSLQDLFAMLEAGIDKEHFSFHGTEERHVELFPDVKAFLKSVKEIGASNSNNHHYSQSISLFKEMIETYNDNFLTEDQRIPATYHSLYLYVTRDL
ncbi:malonyl-ACP O-methyltransferase BioC [Bacillus sp. FJAT-44742]|uniref:malonyl-ACP O-methyltransferase BioC n=1 Tax=Bacillus sp. FJAT-44742 TaxID=2014005 RepID=UPI000C233ECB|nr:malonyl-ACP O-methyltransferase BioC [Bacillus sp. FJAT-44742]